MDITVKLDKKDLDALRAMIREEFLDVTTTLVAEMVTKTKSRKAAPKADKLEEQAQVEIAKAAAEPKVEITDDDLPANMQPQKGDGGKEGVFDAHGNLHDDPLGKEKQPVSPETTTQLPTFASDRPITEDDKKEFGPRIRALALAPGVLKEWIKRNTGSDDPWSIGYYRFKLMLDLFERTKTEGNEAIAKFIAGI